MLYDAWGRFSNRWIDEKLVRNFVYKLFESCVSDVRSSRNWIEKIDLSWFS